MTTIPESRRVAERFKRLQALGCIDQPEPKRTYRTMSITEKLKQAALAHPLDVDLSLLSIAAARIEELQSIVSGEFPEGCTPADARVLREANHKLADMVEQLQAKLTRLQKAAQAMRQEIVDRIEPDAEGFQPYDGNMVIWTEFCEATEAAKV